jgi:hypothetical protein
MAFVNIIFHIKFLGISLLVCDFWSFGCLAHKDFKINLAFQSFDYQFSSTFLWDTIKQFAFSYD